MNINNINSSDSRGICSYHSCKNDATKTCAKCQSVFYCSQECQRADWHIHKLKCPMNAYKTQAENLISFKVKVDRKNITTALIAGNKLMCELVIQEEEILTRYNQQLRTILLLTEDPDAIDFLNLVLKNDSQAEHVENSVAYIDKQIKELAITQAALKELIMD